MTTVLVLNASYEPFQRVDLHHAIKMLHRNVAEVHEADGEKTIGPFAFPKVLRLLKFIYARWRVHHRTRWTKQGVMKRDKKMCAYCSRPAQTIDHVLPRSRGGASTWENTVAACHSCNHKKAARTPKEAAMTLHFTPYMPSYEEIYNLRAV